LTVLIALQIDNALPGFVNYYNLKYGILYYVTVPILSIVY